MPLRVANPVWVDDPAFDIATHITAAPTDGALSWPKFTQLVAHLMGEALRPDRPLWHMAVVEALEDQTMALIWRIHHCMADGATAMRLGESLLWDTGEATPDPPAPPFRGRGSASWPETLCRLGTHHHLLEHWAMSPPVFTFNVSNVPGPRGEVFVLGTRLRRLYSLAEIAQHHALRVAVASAAGSLSYGLCAGFAAVPDLDGLSSGIHRAADELLALAG